ncbi:MAG: hypothetical protein ACJA1A_003621 [Saprospiraceae bacterium]|jgi:hypothetical protein
MRFELYLPLAAAGVHFFLEKETNQRIQVFTQLLTRFRIKFPKHI